MPALASALLRSCLVGMRALFDRVAIHHWRDQAGLVLALGDPAEMAVGYRLMSQGSAPGTLHDLIISERNQHPVTERQEPWVNELLTTFESIAATATETIEDKGARASLAITPSIAARRWPWRREGSPEVGDRTTVVVYALRCTTCETRFLLDTAVDQAAARRWSLDVAPARIAAGRSAELVATAFDPERDAEASQAMETVRPAADALGLAAIRLPYNRPSGQPDDRCTVCGADTWSPVPLRLVEDPIRLVPLS
jgi:hypothetical protein